MGGAADILTGGLVSSTENLFNGDPIGSISEGITGGVYGDVGGDIGKLIDSSAESMATMGGTNIEAGLSQNNVFDALDHIIDPSRVNDKWIRQSGELLGSDGRNIVGNYLLPIVASIVGGPVGTVGGSYFGNKIAGGADRDGALRALIAGGASAAGAAASSAAAPLVSSVSSAYGPVAGTVTNAAVNAGTQAGIGAATAAAQGLDPLDAAIAGAATGGIGGLAGPATGFLGDSLDMGRFGHSLAGAATGAASNAATNAMLGSEITPLGLLSSTAGGAWNAAQNYTKPPSVPYELTDAEYNDYINSEQYHKDRIEQEIGQVPNVDLAANLSKRPLSLLNYDESAPLRFGGYDSYSPDSPNYKGTYYDYNSLAKNQPGKWDGLPGKLAVGTLKGLGSYFMDQASTPMPIKEMGQFAVAPAFGGLLNTAKGEMESDGFGQDSTLFNWRRQDAPIIEKMAWNNIIKPESESAGSEQTELETSKPDKKWMEPKKDETKNKAKKFTPTPNYKLNWKDIA